MVHLPMLPSLVSAPGRRFPRAALGLLLAALVAGCGQEEGIRTYTVSKSLPSDRMLAAIVPYEGEAWFLKLTGPNEAVEDVEPAFRKLIASVRRDGSDLAWDLPAGWTKQPGGQMRFATLVVESGGQSLECSVSRLPMAEASLDSYILANINRWRGQMRQPPLTLSELPKQSETLSTQDGRPATVVSIEGELSGGGMAGGMGGGMGAAPFAGGPARPPTAPSSSSASSETSAASVTYEQPASWSEGQKEVSRGGISIRRDAAFEVRDGDRRVEITLTKLPGGAGATLPNVNRWRGQVGLDSVTEEALRADLKQLSFAGSPADYVQFSGTEQTVLGVVAERDGMTWFVKLQGDRELAERERPAFEKFVESIRVQ